MTLDYAGFRPVFTGSNRRIKKSLHKPIKSYAKCFWYKDRHEERKRKYLKYWSSLDKAGYEVMRFSSELKWDTALIYKKGEFLGEIDWDEFMHKTLSEQEDVFLFLEDKTKGERDEEAWEEYDSWYRARSSRGQSPSR